MKHYIFSYWSSVSLAFYRILRHLVLFTPLINVLTLCSICSFWVQLRCRLSCSSSLQYLCHTSPWWQPLSPWTWGCWGWRWRGWQGWHSQQLFCQCFHQEYCHGRHEVYILRNIWNKRKEYWDNYYNQAELELIKSIYDLLK